MDYFLIVVLGIVVFSVWNRNRETGERLRKAVDRLEHEIAFLRAQVASLAQDKARHAVPRSPKASEEIDPSPAPQSQYPPEAAKAAHGVAPHMAECRPLIGEQQPGAGSVSIPVATAHEPAASQPPTASMPKPALQAQPASPPAVAEGAPDTSVPPHGPTAPPVAAVAAFQPLKDPATEKEARQFSLEQTLGANWLNKIGIAILVIGLAFFLAYKLQTWGPVGKVLCGFTVSLALLGGGVWLERKPAYRIFARGGIGGGWALAYFTTFAMYHLQAARIVNSLPVDLLLMMLVAAGMVGHSLRYKSQTVTALAFMLGFATLLTSHIEEPTQTVAFSLAASAILAIALVVVTTLRHWAALELCGLIAVYISHFVWLTKVLPNDHAAFAEFWPSTALILLYWLIFRLAYVLRTPLDKREENLSSVSAILNSGGVLGLLKFQSAHPEWAFWALLVLGIFEMALAWWSKEKRRQAFAVLSTISVVLLVSSVPFRFHGVSWPVLWLLQAQVLAIAGLRLGEPIFRRLGLLVGVITGAILALHDVMPLAIERLMAVDQGRHWSLTAGLALAAFLYWTHAEVYPRRWPEIASHPLESLALKLSSWLALGAAATCLWVVQPDNWLPLGFIALFLVLVIVGHRFNATMPPLEGDVLGLATTGVLIFHHVLPFALAHLENADSNRRPVLTMVLSIAALAFWSRAHLLPRLLPKLSAVRLWDPAAWEAVMLPLASCIGTAGAATAIWVALPGPWVAVGWLALVITLGFAADWIANRTLAVQADALAIAAVIGLFGWDVWHSDWEHRAPLLVAIALLYCAMRRRTVPGEYNFVPPAYSWASAFLLLYFTCDIVHVPWTAPALVALSIALFEIGRFVKKGFLRWQGNLFVAAALSAYFGRDHWSGGVGLTSSPAVQSFTLSGSRLLEVFILIAGSYWLLERSRDFNRTRKAEHIAALMAEAAGTFCLMVWISGRFPLYVHDGAGWITALWASMATVLLVLAWIMRRRTFMLQSIVLDVVAVLRGLLFDLTGESHSNFWHGTLYRLSVAALVLFTALPFAFKLRGRESWSAASIELPEQFVAALSKPEQWFFFAPFGLMVVALATKLSSGHITIAWSLLGLGTFLFALLVGERSFRLAGLGLLLVSVAKILLMDVWALAPPDRYLTLIVLGTALLSVSFLYTRFSEKIRKFL